MQQQEAADEENQRRRHRQHQPLFNEGAGLFAEPLQQRGLEIEPHPARDHRGNREFGQIVMHHPA